MSKIPEIKEYLGKPVVTAEKMRYLDKKASMEYGVAVIDLMENAGKGIAAGIVKAEKTKGAKILICCGRGNNGGDGLVAGRYLKEEGMNVEVLILAPKDGGYGRLVVENLNKAKEKNIPINIVNAKNIETFAEKFVWADIIVDALLGVGSLGKPSGVMKKIIQICNKSGKKIFSVDIPSGLSPDTGHHSGVFITAQATFTLGFAKTGLMAAHAQKNIGELKVVDIGFPDEIMEEAKR